MGKRMAEEVAVNLLFLLVLLVLVLMITPQHSLALAWREIAGQGQELRQMATDLAAFVGSLIRSIGLLSAAVGTFL